MHSKHVPGMFENREVPLKMTQMLASNMFLILIEVLCQLRKGGTQNVDEYKKQSACAYWPPRTQPSTSELKLKKAYEPSSRGWQPHVELAPHQCNFSTSPPRNFATLKQRSCASSQRQFPQHNPRMHEWPGVHVSRLPHDAKDLRKPWGGAETRSRSSSRPW